MNDYMSSMMNINAASFSFSGHETFPFRYGWLKKGVDALPDSPTFFSSDEAMVKLGVGKNMLRSIRHWCLAAGLIQEDPTADGTRGRFALTDLGRAVFADDGLDPYLEDPATLWLIHWKIASNVKVATTWFWVFNHWNAAEFTKDLLVSEVFSWLENCGYKKVADSSLRRDADCFIRTYVHSRHGKGVILEDTLDCPLVDLHLITELSDGRTYQFQRGPQASLPDEVFTFALIEFWRKFVAPNNSMAFEKIAYDPGSPGKIFKLDENSLAGRLDRIKAVSGGMFSYDETGGLKQVYVHPEREIDPFALLEFYYRGTPLRVEDLPERVGRA